MNRGSTVGINRNIVRPLRLTIHPIQPARGVPNTGLDALRLYFGARFGNGCNGGSTEMLALIIC